MFAASLFQFLYQFLFSSNAVLKTIGRNHFVRRKWKYLICLSPIRPLIPNYGGFNFRPKAYLFETKSINAQFDNPQFTFITHN